MYFLLKHAGDTDGISALTGSMEEAFPSCAKLIKLWHSRHLRRAISLLTKRENREACDFVLKPRVMRNGTDPAALKEAATQLSEESGGNLLFEVDRALASWNVDGYDSALAILDEVKKQKPEGTPLIASLARAYLDMAQPSRALELLGDSEDPELLYLRIQAYAALGKKKIKGKLVAKAIKKSAQSTHPAYHYFALKAALKAGNVSMVRGWIEENMTDSLPGGWTARMAGLGAQAMAKMDERNEAEDFLQKTAKRVLPYSGTDEYLETLLTLIRLNIKRTGKYRNRALNLARILSSEMDNPWLLYWQAEDNIMGGSEKIGLRLLLEAIELSPSFEPAFERLKKMDWLNEERTALVKKMLPHFSLE
jgi:hypothetical protein